MDLPVHRYKLATIFRRLRPTVIIATAGRTPAASPDHHQAHLLIEASRFYSQLTKWDDRFDNTPPYRVPHLVYAPFPFEAEARSWHSTFVIDVSDTFEQKLEAIRCYQSQFDEPRFAKVRHFISGHNITTGARCGFAYGELFALPHPVGAADLFGRVRGAQASPAPVVLQDHTSSPAE
jgi:LmbE family N-acetylglucosaminyl deacetylase